MKIGQKQTQFEFHFIFEFVRNETYAQIDDQN